MVKYFEDSENNKTQQGMRYPVLSITLMAAHAPWIFVYPDAVVIYVQSKLHFRCKDIYKDAHVKVPIGPKPMKHPSGMGFCLRVLRSQDGNPEFQQEVGLPEIILFDG